MPRHIYIKYVAVPLSDILTTNCDGAVTAILSPHSTKISSGFQIDILVATIEVSRFVYQSSSAIYLFQIIIVYLNFDLLNKL